MINIIGYELKEMTKILTAAESKCRHNIKEHPNYDLKECAKLDLKLVNDLQLRIKKHNGS